MSRNDSVDPLLLEWFRPGGRLAKALEGYESREAQVDLARDVLRTFQRGGVFLGEAPTGIGKSLAYLVPALLWSRSQRETVVISTYTKSLQGQLLHQDVPRLAAALGGEVRAVQLKGKSNYYCSRRHRLLSAEQRSSGKKNRALDNDFLAWVSSSEDGDLESFPWHAYRDGFAFRMRVSADPSFCGEGLCRMSKDCAFREARKRAATAEILIVNHALLVSGKAAGGVLPPFRSLVIDEAHHLESSLTSQLTRTVSLARIDRALDSWGSGRKTGGGFLSELDTGLLSPIRGDTGREIAELAASLRALRSRVASAAKQFFARIALGTDKGSPYAPRARFETQQEILDLALKEYEELFALGGEAEQELTRLARNLGRVEESEQVERWRSDVESALAEWRALTVDLEELTDPEGRLRVHWRSGAEGGRAEIAAAPVEIGQAVHDWILSELESLVLVSATLRVADDFGYVRNRLGLSDGGAWQIRSESYPTPFDWPRQARAFVTESITPDPEHVTALVAQLYRREPRNTLVLFTSHRALRSARGKLSRILPVGASVWAQDVDGDAPLLAERFRRARGAVLLGTASFWEGVDFPGEALEILVVSKLPFAVPDDPLIEARCQRIEEEGGSGFRDLLLPDAVLRFRQGIGRLLRTKSDRGVVILTDGRAVQKSYGRVFRAALPMPLERVAGAEQLVDRAAAFLRGDGDPLAGPEETDLTMEPSP